MLARLIAVVSLSVCCAPTPTQEDIDAAHFRVGALAFCLADISQENEGTFIGCNDAFLGNGGYDVIRAGMGSGGVLDVRDIMRDAAQTMDANPTVETVHRATLAAALKLRALRP